MAYRAHGLALTVMCLLLDVQWYLLDDEACIPIPEEKVVSGIHTAAFGVGPAVLIALCVVTHQRTRTSCSTAAGPSPLTMRTVT